MLLCYSALSPFCRKVRMALEHKGLAFELFDSGDIKKYPAWNARAEVPMLVHDDLTVSNSADILAYLERAFPDAPSIYPDAARAYAQARAWEREADTYVDAIVTDCGIWPWSQIGAAPEGLIEAGKRDLAVVYDRLEAQLNGRDFIMGGALSVADFALYPHLSSAGALGLGADRERHRNVIDWLRRVRRTEPGTSDREAVLAWWNARDESDVETDRINWGTHRLEWLLANGHVDWFAEQVREGKVIWSVGPASNAKNSPRAPDWARDGA